MKPINIYTYPDAIKRLSQDYIVSRLQPNGRFVDTYVADLVEGDQYHVPVKSLPPRDPSQILDYIASNLLTFEWIEDLDGDITELVVSEDGGQLRELVRYPWNKSKTQTFREAIEYVMDQDEREL